MLKKILIAEDERPMARALELKLVKAGFLIQSASDGQEALELLEKEKFDLIILDLVMPKINGFQVLEEIIKRNIDIKIIVVSNLGQEEDFQKAKKLGAQDYFVKSDTPIAKIIEYIQKILI